MTPALVAFDGAVIRAMQACEEAGRPCFNVTIRNWLDKHEQGRHVAQKGAVAQSLRRLKAGGYVVDRSDVLSTVWTLTEAGSARGGA